MLERDNPKPLYGQLEDILRKELQNNTWQANQLFPSENELSKTYGISRMTVRSVITALVRDGLLYRVQGKGTFVSPQKLNVQATGYQSFREQMVQQGHQVQVEVIQLEEQIATPHLCNLLMLPKGESILYLCRLIYVDAEPICIHKSFVPSCYASNIDGEILKTVPLLQLLKESGVETYSVTESVKSLLPTEVERKYMCIGAWHPLLLVSDLHKTQDGSPFLLAETAFRSEKVDIVFEFRNNHTFSIVS